MKLYIYNDLEDEMKEMMLIELNICLVELFESFHLNH